MVIVATRELVVAVDAVPEPLSAQSGAPVAVKVPAGKFSVKETGDPETLADSVPVPVTRPLGPNEKGCVYGPLAMLPVCVAVQVTGVAKPLMFSVPDQVPARLSVGAGAGAGAGTGAGAGAGVEGPVAELLPPHPAASSPSSTIRVDIRTLVRNTIVSSTNVGDCFDRLGSEV